MKKDIHPEYQESVVRCSCGAELNTRSTKKEMRVDVCSQCHPFFTGESRLVDTEGRIERFERKYGKAWQRDAEKK